MSLIKYEEHAARWEASGRAPAALLTSEWQLLTLRCWLYSEGAKAQSISPLLAEFAHESFAAIEARAPDWYEALLRERDHCSGCGERYRVENLSVCTKCLNTYCFRCDAFTPLAPNGNRLHSCGGEIVG